MTIGGHHPNLILLDALDETPPKTETRLVRGHREQGLFDHLTERVARRRMTTVPFFAAGVAAGMLGKSFGSIESIR
jgi:hypothetical protein